MKIIKSSDVSYDDINGIKEAFISNGIKAELRDELGSASDRVDIVFPSTDEEYELEVVVMIWLSQGNDEVIKYRVTIFDRNKRDELKRDHDLWKDINKTVSNINQNADAYGALSLSSMSGITVDYNLTMAGGIPDHTVINTAREVARGAQMAKESILSDISLGS